MERIFSGNTFEFEDQYIPSGNWYSQSYDDSNIEPFFTENSPLRSLEDIHCSDQNQQHSQESLSNRLGTLPPQSKHDFSSYPYPDQCETLTEKDDPFSVRCRIPVPDLVPISSYQLWLETSFMYRRNERERQRVRSVNDGFSRLRNRLPRNVQMRRRQSKVETLRHAISYIQHLQKLLGNRKSGDCDTKE